RGGVVSRSRSGMGADRPGRSLEEFLRRRELGWSPSKHVHDIKRYLDLSEHAVSSTRARFKTQPEKVAKEERRLAVYREVYRRAKEAAAQVSPQLAADETRWRELATLALIVTPDGDRFVVDERTGRLLLPSATTAPGDLRHDVVGQDYAEAVLL